MLPPISLLPSFLASKGHINETTTQSIINYLVLWDVFSSRDPSFESVGRSAGRGTEDLNFHPYPSYPPPPFQDGAGKHTGSKLIANLTATAEAAATHSPISYGPFFWLFLYLCPDPGFHLKEILHIFVPGAETNITLNYLSLVPAAIGVSKGALASLPLHKTSYLRRCPRLDAISLHWEEKDLRRISVVWTAWTRTGWGLQRWLGASRRKPINHTYW